MPSLDYQVVASADDADQASDGTADITRTPLRETDATGEWNGWRFQNVTIPDGATITSAYLTFYFAASNLDEPDVTIYGANKGQNAYQFTTGSNNISARTRTTASVEWSNANLGAPGWFDTPDLSTIVQELIDNYSYASGAGMILVMTSRANAGTRDTSVQSYDGDPDLAAKLHIEYTEDAAASSVPVIMNSYRQRRA
jgi:type IV pilus assembly protein PilY1